MLAGDLIARALRRGANSINSEGARAPAEGPEQGGTDPGNIAEFLAYDIPFEVEPATGLILPAEIDRG